MSFEGIRMVDVGDKPVSKRWARAEARVRVSARVREAMQRGQVPKGDVIAAGQLAGILAAKRCWEILPLCHPIPIDAVEIFMNWDGEILRIECSVRNVARTGVEMEALTGATVAGLCVYDMCKGLGDEIVVEEIRLLEKGKEPHRAG